MILGNWSVVSKLGGCQKVLGECRNIRGRKCAFPAMRAVAYR